MALGTAPWHAAYPDPKNTAPEHITRFELLEKFRRGEQPGRDFLLVDLRRNDHEVHPRTMFGKFKVANMH